MAATANTIRKRLLLIIFFALTTFSGIKTPITLTIRSIPWENIRQVPSVPWIAITIVLYIFLHFYLFNRKNKKGSDLVKSPLIYFEPEASP
jgi:hypothetical protein